MPIRNTDISAPSAPAPMKLYKNTSRLSQMFYRDGITVVEVWAGDNVELTDVEYGKMVGHFTLVDIPAPAPAVAPVAAPKSTEKTEGSKTA